MNRPPPTDSSGRRSRAASAERQLIDHVGRERDRSLEQIGETASTEAAALLAEARHKARRRVSQAVAEERRRAGRELRRLRAQVDTRLRQRLHEVTGELLQRTWPLIEEALARRWEQDEARRQWLDGALELARRRLPAGDWFLEHPPSLPEPEIEQLLSSIAAAPGSLSVTPRPVDDLQAGVRILCGGACLDASTRGLLADPERINGLLLAHLERADALPEHAADHPVEEP